MLFSSIPFLYVFLPAVVALYFLVPKAGRNAVLLIHGIAGSPNQFRKLIDLEKRVPENCSVFNIRYPGHGGKVTELVFPMPLIAPHHNDRFDLDERVMPLALRCLAALIERLGAE
mgnify:CR=1 FL=1